MRVSVSEAKGQLTELVRRAEAGDEVILTRRGHEIVRLVAMAAAPGLKGRRALMEKSGRRRRPRRCRDRAPHAARTFSMTTMGGLRDRRRHVGAHGNRSG